MIEPYVAVGLQLSMWDIEKRSDIKRNINHIKRCVRSAHTYASLEGSVKLVVLSEGALSGFPDSLFDTEHAEAARRYWIDIPGEETDILGEICKQYHRSVQN